MSDENYEQKWYASNRALHAAWKERDAALARVAELEAFPVGPHVRAAHEGSLKGCIEIVEQLNPRAYTSAKRYQEAVLDRLRAARRAPNEGTGQEGSNGHGTERK